MGACGSTAKPRDGGPDGSGGIGDSALETIAVDATADSRPQNHSCGGTITAGGATPMGDFTATDIYLDVVFVCRRVDVFVTDWGSGLLIGFSLVPGTTSFTGTQTGSATLVPIVGGTPVMTTFDANVTAADDPYATGAVDARPAGSMDVTFSLTHDGLSVTGSFSSPYCGTKECQI